MAFPQQRPRRLRRTPALRRLVAQTRLSSGDLVLPMFVKEGIAEPVPVDAMPGVVQHTEDSLRRAVVEAAESGVGGVMLFGIPAHKDAVGSGADAEDGVVQSALRGVRKEVGDALVVMADLCLCEYTDHGHCGVLAEGEVDNDATLDLLAKEALAHARAGADMVAPSDMMDGRVNAIREALDEEGFDQVPIMSYAAKFASGFYGPFREAAESTPQFGDRRGYQMDPPNALEALREVEMDINEGADIVMVKPALPYLDLVWRVKEQFGYPVAAYQVSGEYAMMKAAVQNGWLDESRVMMETLTAIRRAGADLILTYYAREAARLLSHR